MPDYRPRRSILLLAVLLLIPALASAQSLGIGPRMSFVRGDLATGTPAARFGGATLRIQTSKHMALEGAIDYKSQYSTDRTTRVRQTPLQGSLLMFPIRAAFSPYLLGGVGIYSELTDHLDQVGTVLNTTMARKTGVHIGGGAELFIGRHAALFADYRYRFVKFGLAATDGDPIKIPGLDSLKITHHGSMWTSGVAFYF